MDQIASRIGSIRDGSVFYRMGGKLTSKNCCKCWWVWAGRISYSSLLHQIWRVLWLKTLLLYDNVMKRMLIVVHNGFFILWRILCTIISRGSRGVPRTEPALFFSALAFFQSLATPTDDGRRYYTVPNRFIDDLQHRVANSEEHKLL